MTELFIDSDGVVKNFHARAVEIFGEDFSSACQRLKMKEAWRQVRHYRQPGTGHGFYRSLDLMPDAQELWDAVKHLDPTILTGCPFGDWAPPQKVEAAQEKFGPDVKIITCMARDKYLHMRAPGDVLVDDTEKNRAPWVDAGGVFVLHRNTKETLAELRVLHPEWFDG